MSQTFFLQQLERAQLHLASFPNRGERFVVDLAMARTDVSLGKSGTVLNLDIKGDGVWSIKIVFADLSEVEYPSSELTQGANWEWDFSDIKFTNVAQPGAISPKFTRAWTG